MGLALDRDGVRDSNEAALGRRVICLAGLPIQAAGRPGEEEPAVAIALHLQECKLRYKKGALKVYVENGINLLLGQVRKASVAKKAGIADADIKPPKCIDRGFDDCSPTFARRHAVVIGDRLAAGLHDLIHDPVGCGIGHALSSAASAQIVHNHLAAALRDREGIFSTKAVTRASDNGDPAIKTNWLIHLYAPSSI